MSAALGGRSDRGGSIPQPAIATTAINSPEVKPARAARRDRMERTSPMENAMKTILACAVTLLAATFPALAALDTGDRAPDFTTQAAVGGKVYSYSLAEQLKKGPVVLYFFPAAFTEGCSAEAHYFAESIAQFQALGASVVGVSADDIDTLSRFSVQACQSQFPVASDKSQTVMKSYDAVMPTRPEYANRISYVIAPDGKVVYHYMSLNPTKHVEKMLGALTTLSGTKPRS
jgi:peroxiredoxin